VAGSTVGMNTVLSNLEWNEGDYLVNCTFQLRCLTPVLIRSTVSTTFGTISRIAQYISDLKPHPKIYTIPITLPISSSDLLEHFRKHLRLVPRAPGSKVVVTMDSIISTPGWLMPWREMVKICKEEGALSAIDGAHSIGQEKLDFKKADPDFFVSVSDQLLHPLLRGAERDTELP
jgi:hypothetical protein